MPVAFQDAQLVSRPVDRDAMAAVGSDGNINDLTNDWVH
jgi:hypothetical protein